MFFATKVTPLTPSERLSAALNSLNETLNSVRTAAADLSEEAAELDGRLVLVERNRAQADKVAANLATLLGE